MAGFRATLRSTDLRMGGDPGGADGRASVGGRFEVGYLYAFAIREARLTGVSPIERVDPGRGRVTW